MESLKIYPDHFFLSSPIFKEKIKKEIVALRQLVEESIHCGIASPTLTAAVVYFDESHTAESLANIIEVQRDYFGGHSM